jgi:glycine/D-amino acid oxidase-like deaminating enzyme
MGYPGPLGVRPDAPPRGLSPVRVEFDSTLDCDVVVVGSGAGGGPAAAVLAEAGFDVVVVEKGDYYDDRDFDGGELSGLSRLYAAGPSATTNGQLSLLSGQTLGGGTVVNCTTCFRTPERVRGQWASLGAGQFAAAEYAEAMDAVWARLSVNTDHGRISARDEIMEKGLRSLGWHVDEMPRNVLGCDTGVECGRCGYGCRIGAKQSTAKTWLADAEVAGARLYVGVDVQRVLVHNGQATGIEARTASGHSLTVRARAVVVAGGALQTPALLRRSGLTNPNIGRHLRLHPATAVWATHSTEVRPWEGGIQTRYSTEHADLDGDGYGVIYETAATNPALAVAFMSWRGAQDHLDRMLGLAHLGGVGIITRDRDSGEVRVGKDGEPTVHYTVSDRDSAHMRRGIAGPRASSRPPVRRRCSPGTRPGSRGPGRAGSLSTGSSPAQTRPAMDPAGAPWRPCTSWAPRAWAGYLRPARRTRTAPPGRSATSSWPTPPRSRRPRGSTDGLRRGDRGDERSAPGVAAVGATS